MLAFFLLTVMAVLREKLSGMQTGWMFS